MTLLIGINFNSEHRLCNTNCVPAADKYAITGRNCTRAKLALAIRRYFVVVVVLAKTVGPKQSPHLLVYYTNGKESGYD